MNKQEVIAWWEGETDIDENDQTYSAWMLGYEQGIKEAEEEWLPLLQKVVDVSHRFMKGDCDGKELDPILTQVKEFLEEDND